MRTSGRIAILLSAALLVSGCEYTSGSGGVGSWFDRGRIHRTIRAGTTSVVQEGKVFARSGQTIEVTYDVTLREGSVQIDVWRPMNITGGPKRMTSVTLRESRAGTLTVAVDELLTYQVRVRPYRFAGAYEVSWKAR